MSGLLYPDLTGSHGDRWAPYHSCLQDWLGLHLTLPWGCIGALSRKVIRTGHHFLQLNCPFCLNTTQKAIKDSSWNAWIYLGMQQVLECMSKKKKGIWLYLTWHLWQKKSRWVDKRSWFYSPYNCAIHRSGVLHCVGVCLVPVDEQLHQNSDSWLIKEPWTS